MKESRPTEEQIIGIVRGAVGGCDGSGALPSARHQRPTIYDWKATFAGTGVSEAKGSKAPEAENARLARLLAGSLLGPGCAGPRDGDAKVLPTDMW